MFIMWLNDDRYTPKIEEWSQSRCKKINNELICNLTEYDYLGLKITNTLSWGKHIETLCSMLISSKDRYGEKYKPKVPHGPLSVIYQTTM